MKTSGVSCETKFGLLVFLGHPTKQCTLAHHNLPRQLRGVTLSVFGIASWELGEQLKISEEVHWREEGEKESDHTSYLSRTPRIYSCKFFWADVNFYRFNANNWQFTVYFALKTQKIGSLLCILSYFTRFFGVNLILQKFCSCKKNDKYQVWSMNT